MNSPTRRIALYSHDTKGLGHMRRNLLLAQVLSEAPISVTVLLIAGAHEAGMFAMPVGVDSITLPAYQKKNGAHYESRSLGVSLQELTALRSQIISSALESFNPDLFIVDYAPRGTFDELLPALETIELNHTRCVFGMRDVMFDPAVVREEWNAGHTHQALDRFYEQIWVYGDSSVYDMVQEYRLPASVTDKIRYTGYLDPTSRISANGSNSSLLMESLALPEGRLALCLVGGGQDGAALAGAFSRMELPPDTNGIILTGPFMPEKHRRRLRREVSMHSRMRLLDFVPEPTELLRDADRVIAQGGYNTLCEVLAFEKRALIVPRVNARREQLIRVERLEKLGMVGMLHPDRLNPSALRAWLSTDVPAPSVRDRIDFDSSARIHRLLDELQ